MHHTLRCFLMCQSHTYTYDTSEVGGVRFIAFFARSTTTLEVATQIKKTTVRYLASTSIRLSRFVCGVCREGRRRRL